MPPPLPEPLPEPEPLHTPAEQVWPLSHEPQLPPHPSSPQTLPLQFGVHVVPPPRFVPFGEPIPVGPSQPAPALHSAVPQLPFLPLVTSKKLVAWPYA